MKRKNLEKYENGDFVVVENDENNYSGQLQFNLSYSLVSAPLETHIDINNIFRRIFLVRFLHLFAFEECFIVVTIFIRNVFILPPHVSEASPPLPLPIKEIDSRIYIVILWVNMCLHRINIM